MNSSSSSLVTVVVLTMAISSLAGVAVAQTEGQTRVVPCEAGSPRPTLKRRQPSPDSSPREETLPAQQQQEKPKCEPESDTQQNKDQDQVTVEFKGLYALDDLNVRERLEKGGIVFSKTRMPDSETTNKAAGLLKEMLESQGYLQATIAVRSNAEDRAVKFTVDQGPRLPIADIKFAGNRIFSSHDLAASMEECVADNQEWSDSGHAPQAVEYCLRRVTNFMRNQGYLQASLGEPENQITPNGLAITIPVKEGTLYRFGEIKIEGAEAFTVGQLRSSFAFGRGDTANGGALGKWAYEDLKKLYGNLGYIEFTTEINPEFKAAHDGSNEGVVNISITVDEGKRFRLRSIKFEGRNLPEKELRKLFPMNDGDAYSQQLFEAGIKKLNETGGLEFVDADKNCDFKTDEEEDTVTIVIKVSPSHMNEAGKQGHL
jgi:outer membrane protein insertion porin family